MAGINKATGKPLKIVKLPPAGSPPPVTTQPYTPMAHDTAAFAAANTATTAPPVQNTLFGLPVPAGSNLGQPIQTQPVTPTSTASAAAPHDTAAYAAANSVATSTTPKPAASAATGAPAADPKLAYFQKQFGGQDQYASNQNKRYADALASGDTALIAALQKDAARVGYSLTDPNAAGNVQQGGGDNLSGQFLDQLNGSLDYGAVADDAQARANKDAMAASEENRKKFQELIASLSGQQKYDLETLKNQLDDSKSSLEDQSFQSYLQSRQDIANRGVGGGSGLQQDANTRLSLARQGQLASLGKQAQTNTNDINRKYDAQIQSAAETQKNATNVDKLMQEFFTNYSAEGRKNMMDQANLYADLFKSSLPYDYQTADSKANTKFNYDKLSTENKQFYDKLGADDKQFYDKLNQDYDLNLTQIMGYDAQGNPTLDYMKAAEAIRSNKANEGIASNRLTAEMTNWSVQNNMKASEINLDVAKFGHQVHYDNEMIKKASAELGSDSSKMVVNGLQNLLDEEGKRLDAKIASKVPLTDADLQNYNEIKGKINGILFPKGSAASTSGGSGDTPADPYGYSKSSNSNNGSKYYGDQDFSFQVAKPIDGKFSTEITTSAEKYNVSASLVKAMATQESSLGGNGITNVMQVNGMNDSSAAESIDRGTSMISRYVKEYGNVEYALAAYNMGPGVIKYMKKNGITDVRQGMSSFSTYMKQKNGYKVYGDPNYVDNVMRYYK